MRQKLTTIMDEIILKHLIKVFEGEENSMYITYRHSPRILVSIVYWLIYLLSSGK